MGSAPAWGAGENTFDKVSETALRRLVEDRGLTVPERVKGRLHEGAVGRKLGCGDYGRSKCRRYTWRIPSSMV